MPALAQRRGLTRQAAASAGLALAALLWLAPIAADLARGPWRDAMHSHGPVVLVIALALAWRALQRLPAAMKATRGAVRGGFAVLLSSLVLAALGRWGDAPVLQAVALAPAMAGIALVCGGVPLLRALAFPIGFLLFVVPLPSALADMLTLPMKHGVSHAAAAALAALGYTVSLDGVVLGIGPYRLLVADACAGLGSLLMLEAFGLLYLHLVRHPSPRRTAVLALAIVPISLAANVVRVVLLALVTVHFGDEAGQGLVHRASGVILFIAALAMIGPLDALLRRVWPAPPVRAASQARVPLCVPSRRAWSVSALLLLGAAMMALGPLPPPPVPDEPAFETWMPLRIGDWQALPERAMAQVAAATDGAAVYDDLFARTYRHADGRQVMLTLAYARQQTRTRRAHDPALCYAAAGFSGTSPTRHEWQGATTTQALVAARMRVEREGRREAVVWWIRMGERQDTPGALRTGTWLLQQRLAGAVPDGMLVRASTLAAAGETDAEAYAAPQAFLNELLAALPPSHRALLAR